MNQDLPGTPISQICSLDAERKAGSLILRLYGEFDLSADERFHDELAKLLSADTTTMIVDLRGLTFMDSTGLRALVTLENKASAANYDFAILYEGGTVARVLTETGLDRVLPVIDTHDAVTPPSAA